MAAPRGTPHPHLTSAPGVGTEGAETERYRYVEDDLRKDPWSFQFFQAVRLIERIMAGRKPVGGFVHPSKEVVRFGTSPSSAFPASQIQGLEFRGSGAPLMMVNFMGLTGPLGVLPLYYTELLMERVRSKDRTLLAFFDLFNHRMISLFYQAWEKYRFPVGYERANRAAAADHNATLAGSVDVFDLRAPLHAAAGGRERDRLSHHILDLIGMGTPFLSDRQPVRDDTLLFYSGLLGLHTRSAMSLRQILQDYFDVPVEVEQFMGAWYPLDTADQCRMEDGDTLSEQLAVGAVVGDEIWDQQSGLRIRLGPLGLRQYLDFLPEGSAYEPVRALTRFFAGPELDFEVQLVLRRDEVPACRLDDTVVDRDEVIPQLGWSTWAKTRPMERDPSDTVLRI